MQKIELGEIIATRTIHLIDDSRRITIKIGKPIQFLDSPDYYCPYQITGLGNDNVKYAGGIDAVQALLLTLQKIGIDLYTSNEAIANRLSWEGDEKGDLGFPVPDSLIDLKTKKKDT
jgi:hypothetical protein